MSLVQAILRGHERRGTSNMWTLYDFAGYAGKPTILGPGIRKGFMLWEAQFFPSADHSQLPVAGALTAVGNYALSQQLPVGTPFCIDIESWRSYTVGGGDTISMDDAKVAVQKYVDTIRGVKQAAPSLEFGFFGAALPMEDGFYAISKSPPHSDLRGAALQKMVLHRKIAAESDILFPSCYAYSPDSAEWRASFALQMDLCRQLSSSCKVIPFLWPQYPGPTPQIGGQFVSGDMWRGMLDACFEQADGAAIYGESSTTWASAYAQYWWPETQRFVIDHHLI